MMAHKYIPIGLVLAALMLMADFTASAQQAPQFNQYFFNPLGINPAYAGSREGLSLVGMFRSQWVGFEGAPQTQTFAIHGPLARQKMGLGFQVTNDQIGPRNTVSAEVDYAYRFPFLKGKMAFGLGAGFQYYTFDWNKIDYRDPNDPIPTFGVEQVIIPDADFGAFYHTKKLYLGLEIAHLTTQRLNLTDSTLDPETAYRQFRHVSFTAGYAFVLSPKVTFKPSLLYKQSGLYRGFLDLNASVLLDERLWLGVTVRPTYGLVGVIEYVMDKRFRIGYSFDYALNQFRITNATSHEFFIGYDFGGNRSASISPRYF